MRRIAGSALVAIVAATLMQAIRVTFPLLYDVREGAGASTAVLWALGAFVVGPLILAGLATRVPTGFRVAVLALAVARLALQFLHPIPVWLGAAAVAVGLTAVLLVVITARSGGHGGDAGVAIVVGLALDAAILGAFETWDPVWQDGIAAVSVGVTMALVLAVAATVARPEPARGRLDAWPMVLLGPFLLLHAVFVQNVAFATSETGAPIAGGTAFVLLGSVLGVLAASALVPSEHGVAHIATGAVLVASVGALALVQGASVAVAQPVAGAAAGAVLALALCAPARDGHASGASAHLLWSVLGAGLFVGAAFAYQIDIDVPLPVPRATWPLAAAIALASASVRRHRPTEVSMAPAVVPVVGAVIVPLLLVVGGTRPAPVTASGTYRVLDWNIHTAVDGDGQLVLGAVLDAIQAQGPDVVVLQEVGRGWPIAGQADGLEWLARHLDMEHVWAPAADGQFGNAILSSHPIELDRVLQLPYGEGPQERSAVGATIGGDPSLFVVGVHLQHGDRPATRTEQIEAVIETWGDLDAWLMAGDLNMQPAEADASLLEESGLSSVQDLIGDPDASTARDPQHPGDRVDWIWVTAGTLEVSNFAIPRSEASDHLPLVVDVTP
jgi:endonuclease/exonuclease/phosphatase family metal-dependent hydrolase